MASSVAMNANPSELAVTLYGIPNCDTVKKARTWLSERGVAVQFHDFKKAGVSAGQLQAWMDATGWQTVLNKRGTTWRRLDAAAQAAITDAASAVAWLQTQPSAIKRPVVQWPDGAITVGFDEVDWQQRLPQQPIA